MSSKPLADIREDYRLATLDDNATGADPLLFFRKWFSEAEAAEITEVNAMTLATADGSGKPHARIVLLKALDEHGFVFFTNYDSNKGHEIAAHAEAALVFFWKELQRQVRIEGRVEKVSAEESDEYHNSRPIGSRLGAWASPQSRTVADREVLEQLYQEAEARFADGNIPRPEHWGGYRVIPNRIEFWQGRSNRMHDRIVYELAAGAGWSKVRLAP